MKICLIATLDECPMPCEMVSGDEVQRVPELESQLEEAYLRIIPQIKNAAVSGKNRVVALSNNTDIVALRHSK